MLFCFLYLLCQVMTGCTDRSTLPFIIDWNYQSIAVVCTHLWIDICDVNGYWIGDNNCHFLSHFFRTNVPKSTGNSLLSVQFARFPPIDRVSSVCTTQFEYSINIVVSSRTITATGSIASFIVWTGEIIIEIALHAKGNGVWRRINFNRL